jgi:hypothetical protein
MHPILERHGFGRADNDPATAEGRIARTGLQCGYGFAGAWVWLTSYAVAYAARMAGELRASQKRGASGGAWRPSCTEGDPSPLALIIYRSS